MPQKEKLNAEEKVKIVRMYQRGEISLLQAAQYAGVGKTTINRWITRYKAYRNIYPVWVVSAKSAGNINLEAITGSECG